MKKVLLLAVAGVFVLASCTKDRTCECTTNGVATTSGYSSKTIYKNVSKSFMKNVKECVSTENTTTQTANNVVTTTVTKRDCEIK